MYQLIKVLVVDDQTVVRKGLSSLTDCQMRNRSDRRGGRWRRSDGESPGVKPRCHFLDLAMLRKSGVEAILEISTRDPGTCVFILTGLNEEDQVTTAIRAGSTGRDRI